MTTSKAASKVYYRDPAAHPDEDGRTVTQHVPVVDGDVGGVVTVKLDDGTEVQVAPIDSQMVGAAFYAEKKDDLPFNG